jgi:maleate cis-trans isomerase
MTTAYPGAPYGWRARIGLLQPSMVSDNNPIEFYLMAPPGVQMVLTSMGIADGGNRAELYARAIADIEIPIRRLLNRKVDVIVQSGVPPVVTRGWGFEDELAARVATITDLPFASDIGCCIAAFRALGVVKVAVLADNSMLQGMADYLGHAGLEQVATGFPGGVAAEPGAESLGVFYRGAAELHRAATNADVIYIPGANRPTVGMIQALEEDIGIPIVTSAQATFWRGLCLAGVNPALVSGYGRLFQTGGATPQTG